MKRNTLGRSILVLGIATVSLAALPMVAGASTATTTISSIVSQVVSLSTSGTVNINTTPTGSGVQTIASDTVSVSTNDTAGYVLKLGETGATTTLTAGGNTIPASSGTQSSPVAMASNTWGYRVDSIGGFGAGPTTSASNSAISGSITFAGVAASGSPNTIKTTATTASGDTTTVWYGVATTTAQAAGTYTNSVTYTALGN